MSSSHVVEIEQFGSSPIGTQILSEFVGTMKDPLVVLQGHDLPNCSVVGMFMDGAKKELEPLIDFHIFQTLSSIDGAWRFLLACRLLLCT